ncbi:MAG: ribonuclease J [Candidatus Levybacteria bacterium]|nr:ribonuclease J [Candidatus Levybacteria bacterium]
MQNQLLFTPLGGIGDVTKNMYLYEYKDQVLIVDCGLGFADETMLGVDLLLPDISYLAKAKKKIIGLLLTHGHEDHIGALPFVYPQLLALNNNQPIPMFGTAFTAALANEKLKEYGVGHQIKTVPFDGNEVVLGNFRASFIRVTHSVPDTSHILIKTPVGNIYHGSDFKFDDTPFDGKVSDYAKISQVGKEGVMCLMSDCLGSERPGCTGSENKLSESFEKEIKICQGKFIVTTYSSNIARINQVAQVSERYGRHIIFIGRSLIRTKEVAQRLGYLRIRPNLEVELDQIKNYSDNKLTLIVAGSQGQENSGMARIANGEHREIKLASNDTVIFSADPIPGNEVIVNELIDTIAKRGTRVVYSAISRNFHVSGHGSLEELGQLIKLVQPNNIIPIGGNFRHMAAYRDYAQSLGYRKNNIFLLEDGQEVVFSETDAKLGKIIPVKNVYVDEISGEELEGFILRDRQKLSEGGIVIILCEIDSGTGQLVEKPEIIVRGFIDSDSRRLANRLFQELKNALSKKRGRVTNWIYIRNLVSEVSERRIYKDLRRRPLVLPVVIEV